MLISSLPGANPCLSEHKIGVFVLGQMGELRGKGSLTSVNT